MSWRAFSSRIRRNPACSARLLPPSSYTYATPRFAHHATSQTDLLRQIQWNGHLSRPMSTQIAASASEEVEVPSEPFESFIERFRESVATQAVNLARWTCRSCLKTPPQPITNDNLSWTREQLKDTLTSVLCLLASSGHTEDLELVGRMLHRMHDSWNIKVDAKVHDRVFQELMAGNRLVSAGRWLTEMSGKPGNCMPSKAQWNTFLNRCSETHEARLIQSSLEGMRQSGYQPTITTYWTLFDTLFQDGSFPHFAQVQSIVQEMQHDGVRFTRAILDLLIEGYENAGSKGLVAQVTKLYEELVASTAVDAGIDRNKKLGDAAVHDRNAAVKLLGAYINKGFRSSRETLLRVVESAKKVSDLKFWEMKLNIQADAEIWAIVIQNAAFDGTPTGRYHALEAYRTVGRRGIPKTVEMFFPILRAVCTAGVEAPDDKIIDQALRYLEEFLRDSDESERQKSFIIYEHMIRATTKSKNTRKYFPIAVSLVDDMLSRDVHMTPITTTSLLLLLMDSCRYSNEAYEMYKKLYKTNYGEYALDMKGYEAVANNFCKRSFHSEDSGAPRYFEILKDMRSAGYRITTKIYHNVLNRLTELADGLKPDDDVARAKLIKHVAHTHDVISLDPALIPDIPLWNKLIETYDRMGCFREAYELWQTMLLSDSFDNSTVAIIVTACVKNGVDDKAVEVYGRLHDRRFKWDEKNWNQWLDCLCRVGRLDDAVKLMCMEMTTLKSFQPTEHTVRLLLKHASRTNQEGEVRARVQRYLPTLWQSLPNNIRMESL